MEELVGSALPRVKAVLKVHQTKRTGQWFCLWTDVVSSPERNIFLVWVGSRVSLAGEPMMTKRRRRRRRGRRMRAESVVLLFSTHWIQR